MERVNRFGTTQGMIVQDIEEEGKNLLLAIDAKGFYFTTTERVDTGLADTNRYASDRGKVLTTLEKLGFVPEELFEQNKDKIQSVDQTTKKKLNPLKASRRGLT